MTFWKGAAQPRAPSATRRLRLSEKRFQQNIISLAKLRGWAVYHTFDSRRSAEGFPDLVCVRPPRIIIAEVKTEIGRLSDAQEAWLAALTGCPGVQTRVWRPAMWPQIEAALE